ncbi:hypothetical protein ABZS96_45740, partial [Streptomyces avermitilis]|uniref:hypothetical protein n=1 Tax=Streptomyces avermitilis TaxID=33903 RepID=UPI00339FC43A
MLRPGRSSRCRSRRELVTLIPGNQLLPLTLPLRIALVPGIDVVRISRRIGEGLPLTVAAAPPHRHRGLTALVVFGLQTEEAGVAVELRRHHVGGPGAVVDLHQQHRYTRLRRMQHGIGLDGRAVAFKLGIGTTETLREWVRQDQTDTGTRPGTTTE